MEKYDIRMHTKGQSLIEIIIAVAVGGLLIGATVTAIIPMLRSNLESKNIQIATALGQKYLDIVKNLAESNWLNIYNPPPGDGLSKGPNFKFYLRATSTTHEIVSGTTSTVIEGRTFSQYFYIENVNRNFCSSGGITTSSVTTCPSGPNSVGVSGDPSTQKITAVVSWPDNHLMSRSEYLTRNRNKVFMQNDWSGGPGQEGPITVANNKFADSAGSDYGGAVGSTMIQGLSTTSSPSSGTSIDPVYRYAWNDVIGWIDFYATRNVFVHEEQLSGYASSSVGYIALDCATSPNGNICASSNFKVSVDFHSQGQGNNDRGSLSGYAWNDTIGWISFSGSSPNYQVKIKGNGKFYGWAWNDIIGWISFNCSDPGTCGNSEYKVQTSWENPGAPILAWLISSTFDTQATGGVALNTIMWQGIYPSETSVKFQIASSNNASGPWNYIGPDGSNTTYYAPAGPDLQVQINLQYHNNQRYFRYKMFLSSDGDGLVTPQVDNVIINWSP